MANERLIEVSSKGHATKKGSSPKKSPGFNCFKIIGFLSCF